MKAIIFNLALILAIGLHPGCPGLPLLPPPPLPLPPLPHPQRLVPPMNAAAIPGSQASADQSSGCFSKSVSFTQPAFTFSPRM